MAKKKISGKVPDTKSMGEDLSISNAVRRIKASPKDVDNVMTQSFRLHPFVQAPRLIAEGYTRLSGALGNKNSKSEIKKIDSTYQAQKKAIESYNKAKGRDVPLPSSDNLFKK